MIMTELSPSAFFKAPVYAPSFLKELLEADSPVWTILDDLEDILNTNMSPNIPEVIEPMTPLDSPIVILPEGWLSQGFELRLGTKGEVQVIIEGEHVKEASVVLPGAIFQDRRVQLGKGVVIESTAFIKGPAVIMDHTEVRHGAYVRGNCYFGRACVVGHTTEVKHSIFLDGAKAGHFAYIGDSVLGHGVNLGAGTKLANLRLDARNIVLSINGDRVDTGRRKLGAILGDDVQTGCNTVTNPGTILGPGSLVLPNTTVMPGVYEKKTVIG